LGVFGEILSNKRIYYLWIYVLVSTRNQNTSAIPEHSSPTTKTRMPSRARDEMNQANAQMTEYLCEC